MKIHLDFKNVCNCIVHKCVHAKSQLINNLKKQMKSGQNVK